MNFRDFRTEVLAHVSDRRTLWIYRGHADRCWDLVPSYGRFHEQTRRGAPLDHKPFEQMLTAFVRAASAALGQDILRLTTIQRMALAQHHGLPTPLLDWSASPFVATYFAVADPSSMHAATVEFDVHALHVDPDVLGSRIIEDGMPQPPGALPEFGVVSVNPFFSRRVIRQTAWFTLQTFRQPLRTYLDGLPLPRPRLVTYHVEGSRQRILDELVQMGITGGALFDDLDHVSRDIVNDWSQGR